MTRDIINQIKSIRARSEFLSNRYEIISRLSDIEYSFDETLENNRDFDKELLKYVPIVTVACFEAFFRSVIKELIDFGMPFSGNAIKFNKSKNVKFDFDIINAIQSKTVTIGEFLSHILPCNNFDDINANLSTLADIDFIRSLKTFKEDSIYDFINKPQKIFIDNFDQIITDIKRTFELRHIFCHEFTTSIKVDKDEILRCLSNSNIFLNHTNDFIWHLLYPNAPKTQTEMNIQASETFDKADNSLTEIISAIKIASKEHSVFTLDDDLFDKSIDQWKKYREIKAESDSSYVEGGSMQRYAYASSMTATTNEKIESLKNEYSITLRRYAGR